MQNNITELTQKLLRALDSNYNVIDMDTVIEVVRLLENVQITKELLEATRLGKHINELRRSTTNGLLAKQAKELLKKWRSKVLAVPTGDTNGQLKPTLDDPGVRKRLAKEKPESTIPSKRTRVNGASEYEFSDNSNSSFKDAIVPKNVILINSDSNSSLPDVKNEPVLEEQQPKKRGRKKGSKNHRSLLDEAEHSFSNKMAVSRGNAKVKTTQELVASLQCRNNATTSPGKNIEDWNERAAKLTERVSLIDQKLNASASRLKKKRQMSGRNVLESGSVTNIKPEQARSESPDEEIVIVDEDQDSPEHINVEPEPEKVESESSTTIVPSLSVEEALSRLPPIDTSCLQEVDDDHLCICVLHENTGDDVEERFTFVENPDCPARIHMECEFSTKGITQERIDNMHTKCIENVNGNFGIDTDDSKPEESEDIVNIVPNFYELSPKQVDRDSVCENYKKYSISDCGESDSSKVKFREYHEVLDRPSYNEDVLRILPYVVID